MLAVVACQCGSSDTLVRAKLAKFGYAHSMDIPIVKGREKSYSKLNTLPQFPEVKELRAYIQGVTKWAIIIGYDNERMRWVDLANGTYVKNDVDAELLIQHFCIDTK